MPAGNGHRVALRVERGRILRRESDPEVDVGGASELTLGSALRCFGSTPSCWGFSFGPPDAVFAGGEVLLLGLIPHVAVGDAEPGGLELELVDAPLEFLGLILKPLELGLIVVLSRFRVGAVEAIDILGVLVDPGAQLLRFRSGPLCQLLAPLACFFAHDRYASVEAAGARLVVHEDAELGDKVGVEPFDLDGALISGSLARRTRQDRSAVKSPSNTPDQDAASAPASLSPGRFVESVVAGLAGMRIGT